MIFIDTDIFVIERLFPNDERYIITNEFLNSDLADKCTSIFNLFELLGIASFNLNIAELKRNVKHFKGRTDIPVKTPAEMLKP